MLILNFISDMIKNVTLKDHMMKTFHVNDDNV